MSDIQRYIPMKRIVAMALDGCASTDFDRMWVFAFRAYVDLLGRSQEPKSVRLPVTAQKTAIIPGDYLSWSKIGIMNADGIVSTLKINNSLSKFRALSPGRIAAISPVVNTGISSNPYYLNMKSGAGITHPFGLNSGLIQAGSCTVDEKNRVIVLDPGFSFPDIVFEYLFAPEQDKDYEVDIYLTEPIIAFCEWKNKTGSEDDYYNRIREARRKIDPIRTQVVNQSIRESSGWKVKG